MTHLFHFKYKAFAKKKQQIKKTVVAFIKQKLQQLITL